MARKNKTHQNRHHRTTPTETLTAPTQTHTGLVVLSIIALGVVGLFIWVVIDKVISEGELPGVDNELVLKSIVNPDVFTETADELTYYANKIPIVNTTDPVRGEEDALVTIIEFANFESPYCAQVRERLDKIYQLYEGQVRIVWKDFPMEDTYPNSKQAAVAARCAQRQGKFWDMHDALFVHYLELSEEKIAEVATEVGLNIDQFNQCYESGVVNGYINANKLEGESLEITDIPYVYINNQALSGNVSLGELKTTIDQELLEE